MKEAILVTGLITKSVRMAKCARYHVMNPLPMLIATDGEMLVGHEMTVTERVVPITQICYGKGKRTVYLAYSHEVEELLGIPFNCVLKEKDEAIAENYRLRNLTAWQHIKAAWRKLVAPDALGQG